MQLKKLIGFAVLLSLAGLAAGCATPYMIDRGRDAADVFTATVGMGAGAKARVGPLQVGALFNVDMKGLRGGHFGDVPFYETLTFDWLIPIPAGWIGRPMPGSGRFGEERFASKFERSIPWQRGKSFLAKAPLPILGLAEQPEYYTQIDVVVGIIGTVRIGFNPGELLDFLLGWTTVDLYGDDLEARRQKQKTNQTLTATTQ